MGQGWPNTRLWQGRAEVECHHTESWSRPPKVSIRLLHLFHLGRADLLVSAHRRAPHLASTHPLTLDSTRLVILMPASPACPSDPAVKQILLQLDQSEPARKFIIDNLDDTHLLVTAEHVDRVKEQLQLELEKNNYVNIQFWCALSPWSGLRAAK